jgi:glycosyltransferase involved in cell wall biosynthesis
MKKILMVVFHYPPLHGSSGIHRTLNFSRYLPDHGWQPLVLTVRATAYPNVSADAESRIPAHVPVTRARALDSARHLSFRGYHPRILTLPDRWATWWPGGVINGMRLIREHQPDLIWSTFPIATAHMIGLTLHRLSKLPWVADFRDPMTEKDPLTGEEFPSDRTVRRVNGWIERPAVRHCARAVFTTQGEAQMYTSKYGHIPASRWAVIPNGYDEESFEAARGRSNGQRPCNGRLVLVHSGVLYPDARNPSPFFKAVAQLRQQGAVSAATLQIILRASGHDSIYGALISQLNIGDIVQLEASIPYEPALAEMLAADGLLIFQAPNCNWQIPAKAYEYLRARRPILAFTDPQGDTGKLLQSEGIDTIVPIDSSELIARGLLDFIARIKNGTAPVAAEERVTAHSRRGRTRELAALLDSVTSKG